MISKKHKDILKECPNNSIQIGSQKFSCKYCGNYSNIKSGVSKHIKYSCKYNDDEDIKELVRLLNEQNKKKDDHIKELIQNNTKFMKQTEMLQKQIDRLTRKLQVQAIGTQNTLNNNNNGIINYNVKLLNFRD